MLKWLSKGLKLKSLTIVLWYYPLNQGGDGEARAWVKEYTVESSSCSAELWSMAGIINDLWSPHFGDIHLFLASTNDRCGSYVVKLHWVGELILEYGGKAIEREVQWILISSRGSIFISSGGQQWTGSDVQRFNPWVLDPITEFKSWFGYLDNFTWII